ncbi:hypothetical protein ANAPC2_01397 [Anaplasma phagocytophilum]|nr:hypothetical protein ANAPC2_01397 [Anaplasma phagocytophilum]
MQSSERMSARLARLALPSLARKIKRSISLTSFKPKVKRSIWPMNRRTLQAPDTDLSGQFVAQPPTQTKATTDRCGDADAGTAKGKGDRKSVV